MNREQLKRLMKKSGWTMEQVAATAMVSQHTVRAWLRPVTSRAHRNMRLQSAAQLHAAAELIAKPAARIAPPGGASKSG